ncbi:MAG: 6-bladed beta-propeller [bacterium]|nr:6-bladed beta-propeller [bacterium]
MMKHCVLILVFLLLTTGLFPVKIADLEEVIKPGFLQVDGDDLFVVEAADRSILVYSLKTNKLKLKVGKKGEGPGEYAWPPRIQEITKDYFMATSVGKCVWYSRTGELKREQKVPAAYFRLKPVKNHYFYRSVTYNHHIITAHLNFVDSNFENPKEFYSEVMDWTRKFSNDPPSTETKVVTHLFDFLSYGDKFYLANSHKGFVIEVFDSNGKLLYTIDKTKEIAPLPIGDAYKVRAREACRKLYPRDARRFRPSSFTFYKNFPAMKSLRVDEGKIYITTFNVNKDGLKELIVLNLKGEILGRTFLPFKSTRFYYATNAFESFTFHKGTLYELVNDDEREMYELHATDISFLKK